MNQRILTLLLVVATVFFAGCATQKQDMHVPLSDLQANVEKAFPIHKRYQDLFDVIVHRPRLTIESDNGKLELTADLVVTADSSHSWEGAIKMSGAPRAFFAKSLDKVGIRPWHGKENRFYDMNFNGGDYHPLQYLSEVFIPGSYDVSIYSHKGIFFLQPNVNIMELKGIDSKLSDKLKDLGHVIAGQIAFDVPLYEFMERDFHSLGYDFAPHEITTKADRLIVSFSYWNHEGCGCLSDDDSRVDRLLLPNLKTTVLVKQ